MPRYILLRETASTNTYLARMASMLPSGTVIYTYRQTAGRGQRGNSWESEPEKNLAFSLLLKNIAVSPEDQFYISEAASLAVADFLSRYTEGITVKWPNDVYCHDRKICGMLIENSLQGTAINNTIVGIGININQTEFRSNAPNPVSLAQATGREHDLDALLHEVCEMVEKALAFSGYGAGDFAALHSRYLASLYRRDGRLHTFAVPADGNRNLLAPVNVNPEGWQRFEARIDSVTPDGLIHLTHPDGTQSHHSFKELAFVI